MPLLNDLLDFSDYPLMPPPSAQITGTQGIAGDDPETAGTPAGDLEAVCITKRPRPARPGAVKMSKTRYPVKSRTAPLK